MSKNNAEQQPSRKRMREMYSPATLVRGGSLKPAPYDVLGDSLPPDQIIDEASIDSFPASDPPSWVAGAPHEPSDPQDR